MRGRGEKRRKEKRMDGERPTDLLDVSKTVCDVGRFGSRMRDKETQRARLRRVVTDKISREKNQLT